MPSYFFQYLCELTLIDADPYLKYLPSTIAACSVVLALHTLGLQSWVISVAYCISYVHVKFYRQEDSTVLSLKLRGVNFIN